MDNSLTVSGVPVIVIPDERLPIKGYIQNRTHRKKRINKKWRKRYGETPIRDKSAGWVAVGPYGGTYFFVSQKVYDALLCGIEKR